MWNKWKKDYFYTLEDILKGVKTESEGTFSTATFNVVNLESFLDENFVGDSLNIDNDTVAINTTYFEKLWQLIYSRYRKHYCIRVDEEIERFSYNENVIEFFINYLNIWIFTKDKYIKILEIYEANKDDLLKQISTSSSFVNRYNDTPQDEGVFDSDEHTTNLTEGTNTSSSDGNTIMARIDEISRSYELVILRWVDEFDKLFLEEQSYE